MVLKEEMFSIVSNARACAIRDGKLPEGDYPQVKIEFPKEEKFGDYSSPVAMESAKIVRKNPFETAELIGSYIEKNELIEKVDIVRPGFINIHLSRTFLAKNIEKIRAEGDAFGRRKKDRPRKVNIEFVSANPTGPLNVVSARAAAIGDTLANLMEANGDIVDREFYVNDYGNQVTLLGKSVCARYFESIGKETVFPEDGYHGEYVRDVAAEIAKKYPDDIIPREGDLSSLEEFFSEKAVEYMVAWQQKDMESFNVHYSQWFRESSLHKAGEVFNTLSALENKGVLFEEDGKKVFRSTSYGDDKDRVVMRDDGRPTYLCADIAYHKNKFDRGYDEIIDIWGPDHHGYIARIKGAMKALGYDDAKFRLMIAQQVNLLSGGELVKMSKRLGNFSKMSDLIEEIGPDVARFFFVMRSLESHLDFDLELAKKQSSENPVFYLQYAHARVCSIFREAEKSGKKAAQSVENFSYFDNDESTSLMKMIMKFPDEVMDAADNLEPHRITNYLLRLAQGYHKFYFEHRILTDDIEKTSYMLMLCDAVRITLKNGLSILGVSAPERM